jgi:CRISPR-associated protein Csb1
MLSYSSLLGAVTSHAAIRRRRRLQPAGGPGDKLFPPTYPGEEKNSPPRHVFERRRVDGRDVACVLIDSVQSQANRLEEALLEAAKEGTIRLPRVVVDFPGAGLNSVPEISSLEAPHRIFDAILRDSNLDGKDFRTSPVGEKLVEIRLRYGDSRNLADSLAVRGVEFDRRRRRRRREIRARNRERDRGNRRSGRGARRL